MTAGEEMRAGAELRARYGTPEMLAGEADAEMVMRLTGRSDTSLSAWAVACRYPSVDAYYAFAAFDWQCHGHETIGPARGAGGAIYGLLIPDRRDGISRAELMTRFGGQSQMVPDTAMVLGLLGRDDIDPGTVIAFSYATTEAFEAYADGNKRHHGHETLGPVTGPDGQVYGLLIFAKPDAASAITDSEGGRVAGVWSDSSIDPVVRASVEPGTKAK